MDSSTEAYGKVDTTCCGVAPPPFLAPEEPFCSCVVGKVSLTSRMEICGLFIFYLGGPQVLPALIFMAPAIVFILEYLSTGDSLQLLSLGPVYLLPQRVV